MSLFNFTSLIAALFLHVLFLYVVDTSNSSGPKKHLFEKPPLRAVSFKITKKTTQKKKATIQSSIKQQLPSSIKPSLNKASKTAVPLPKKNPQKKIKDTDFENVVQAVKTLTIPAQKKKALPEFSSKSIDQILSLNELDVLKNQLSSCWRLPAGVKGIENLKVTVTVNADKHGKVLKTDIVKETPYQSTPYTQIAEESALRALRHPRCTPLKLPAEKFQSWQKFTLTFNPKEIIE